jgi:hypothetical protein
MIFHRESLPPTSANHNHECSRHPSHFVKCRDRADCTPVLVPGR